MACINDAEEQVFFTVKNFTLQAVITFQGGTSRVSEMCYSTLESILLPTKLNRQCL